MPNSSVGASQGNSLKAATRLICHIYAVHDFLLSEKKQASNAVMLCAFQGIGSQKDPLRSYMLAYHIEPIEIRYILHS